MAFEKIKKIAGYITAISSSVAAISLAVYAFGSQKIEPKTEPVIVNVENKIYVNNICDERLERKAEASKASLEQIAQSEKCEKQPITIFDVLCSKGFYRVEINFALDRENYRGAYLWLESMLAGCKGQGLSDKAINALLKCIDANQNNVLELNELKEFETKFYRKKHNTNKPSTNKR